MIMIKMNTKSDVRAKKAYVEKLEKSGYTNVAITASPSDIVAEKDGEKWYFEIKKTNHDDKYFGAATVTEWEQAIKTPERFRFVVAISTDGDETFTFLEYTPEEFLSFSTIPPFKIFFNIDFSGKTHRAVRNGRKKSAIRLSYDLVRQLVSFYNSLRTE